jgi:hypothetical protein
MIHVAAFVLVLGARDEVDHRAAGAQLHQADLRQPPLDIEAQNLFVKGDRAVHVGHPQDDMVEAFDLQGGTGIGDGGCIIGHRSAPFRASAPR